MKKCPWHLGERDRVREREIENLIFDDDLSERSC